MQEIWQRFLAALATLSPTVVARLNPGVDDATIAQVEQQLDISLPEEVKEYFRVQNGSNGPLFGSWAMLSLEELSRDWQAMKTQSARPSSPANSVDYFWDGTGLPLLRASPHVYLYVKIALTEEERIEDVYDDYWKYPCFFTVYRPPRKQLGDIFISASSPDCIAFSIKEFLDKLTDSLEEGHYIYDKSIESLRMNILRLPLPLPRINEPSFYEIDEDLPGVELVFGDRVAYPGLCCISYTRDYAEQNERILQQSVIASWELIRGAIEQLMPGFEKNFRSGATNDKLLQIEQQLGVQLPKDVKTWYSLCDGVSTDERGMFTNPLLDFWSWYDLDAMIWQWEMQRDYTDNASRPVTGKYLTSADARIQQVWWHPHWLPFMDHEDDSLLCIDLAPSPQGQHGQIILLLYKSILYTNPLDMRRLPPVLWVAPGLRQFLAALAQDFVSGRYTFNERDRMLWSKEGLAYVEEDENLRERLKERREPSVQEYRALDNLDEVMMRYREDLKDTWYQMMRLSLDVNLENMTNEDDL